MTPDTPSHSPPTPTSPPPPPPHTHTQGFNKIYNWNLASSLKRIFLKHQPLWRTYSGPGQPQRIPEVTTIREFDEAITVHSFGERGGGEAGGLRGRGLAVGGVVVAAAQDIVFLCLQQCSSVSVCCGVSWWCCGRIRNFCMPCVLVVALPMWSLPECLERTAAHKPPLWCFLLPCRCLPACCRLGGCGRILRRQQQRETHPQRRDPSAVHPGSRRPHRSRGGYTLQGDPAKPQLHPCGHTLWGSFGVGCGPRGTLQRTLD